jgi:hypothetical protein
MLLVLTSKDCCAGCRPPARADGGIRQGKANRPATPRISLLQGAGLGAELAQNRTRAEYRADAISPGHHR